MGKGETMKGLLNNKEAVNTVNRIDSMLENRLHQIYNLGYNQGFKDGASETVQKLVDNIMDERRADESNTERD